MGKGLVIGVATTIYVDKYSRYKAYTKEEILEILKNKINLDLYEVGENTREVVLKIKEDFIVKHLYNLLKSEAKEREEYIENLNDLLEKIKKAKTFQEINDLIYDSSVCCVGLCDNPFGGISYITGGELNVSASLIYYISTYKVLFETYGSILDYIREKIIAATDNPLRDDIFIMVSE